MALLNILKNGEIFTTAVPGSRLDIQDEMVTVFNIQPGWQFPEDGEPVYEAVLAPPLPEPTPEEKRAQMNPLTARQFRLGLTLNDIPLSDVSGAIEAIEDPQAKAVAQIEWEYATQFERLHPLVLQLSGVLELTQEQVDAMWEQASSL